MSEGVAYVDIIYPVSTKTTLTIFGYDILNSQAEMMNENHSISTNFYYSTNNGIRMLSANKNTASLAWFGCFKS